MIVIMTQVERKYMQQVDDFILGASPEVLSKLAEIDKKTQLEGLTFYDVYSALSDEDRKQILVRNIQNKKD
ncbi:hypothetical protein [Candidatus Nitrosotenuis chungbukensis]|uniref:hypothetical protein n=2 Tax=Nitrososphaerota incertae sedis TaxID=651142 RepID=UPI000694D08F|nr:hypothetical protein [Candidatus Nitrosotenuis chungbukensis]QLH09134.1 hypothetical protein DSQ19_06330 [Candidatus Nitrosotenuis sp. DW1]